MSFLLDSDFCVGCLRSHPDALRRLAQFRPDEVFVPAVTRAELMTGAYKSAAPAQNVQTTLNFLRPIASLPFDDQAADHYGQIRASLEQQGQKIGPNDLMIAAIASTHGLTVVTRNTREFQRVPGVSVEPW
ncbi:MAG: type II toxin-antitoxin system VapC family toxin [Acidobacteria bacterium]|nr:type II toxin-antitoxin system VapC family toxin [Acidobacteriota bacterium]